MTTSDHNQWKRQDIISNLSNRLQLLNELCNWAKKIHMHALPWLRRGITHIYSTLSELRATSISISADGHQNRFRAWTFIVFIPKWSTCNSYNTRSYIRYISIILITNSSSIRGKGYLSINNCLFKRHWIVST